MQTWSVKLGSMYLHMLLRAFGAGPSSRRANASPAGLSLRIFCLGFKSPSHSQLLGVQSYTSRIISCKASEIVSSFEHSSSIDPPLPVTVHIILDKPLTNDFGNSLEKQIFVFIT
jgi:hypothetical protein